MLKTFISIGFSVIMLASLSARANESNYHEDNYLAGDLLAIGPGEGEHLVILRRIAKIKLAEDNAGETYLVPTDKYYGYYYCAKTSNQNETYEEILEQLIWSSKQAGVTLTQDDYEKAQKVYQDSLYRWGNQLANYLLTSDGCRQMTAAQNGVSAPKLITYLLIAVSGLQ